MSDWSNEFLLPITNHRNTLANHVALSLAILLRGSLQNTLTFCKALAGVFVDISCSHPIDFHLNKFKVCEAQIQYNTIQYILN